MEEFETALIGAHQDRGDVHDRMLAMLKFHPEVCERPDPPS